MPAFSFPILNIAYSRIVRLGYCNGDLHHPETPILQDWCSKSSMMLLMDKIRIN